MKYKITIEEITLASDTSCPHTVEVVYVQTVDAFNINPLIRLINEKGYSKTRVGKND